MVIKPKIDDKSTYTFKVNNVYVLIRDDHEYLKYVPGETGLNFEGHVHINDEPLQLSSPIGNMGRVSVQDRLEEKIPMKKGKGLVSALIRITNSCGKLLDTISLDDQKNYFLIINNLQYCRILVLEEE